MSSHTGQYMVIVLAVLIVIYALIITEGKKWLYRYRIKQSDVSKMSLTDIIQYLSLGKPVIIEYGVTGDPELAIRFRDNQWHKVWHIHNYRESWQVIPRQLAIDLLFFFLRSDAYVYHENEKLTFLLGTDEILYYIKDYDDERWFSNARSLLGVLEEHIRIQIEHAEYEERIAAHEAMIAERKYDHITTQDED